MKILPHLSNNWRFWLIGMSWVDTFFGVYVQVHFLSLCLVLEIDWKEPDMDEVDKFLAEIPGT